MNYKPHFLFYTNLYQSIIKEHPISEGINNSMSKMYQQQDNQNNTPFIYNFL